jgi:Tfp pilus tip-associated adhesin PilY1
VDWGSKTGWTIALPTAKERVAIDMNLQYNTLGVISHVPTGTPCSPSGKSWVYFLNVNNGAGASATTVVGNQITSGLGTGITWFDLGNGESTVLVPDDKLGIHAEVPPVAPPSTTGAAKRVSWRELVN